MTRRTITDPFYVGGIAALEAFEIELIRNRPNIELAEEPTVDIVLDLLSRVLDELRAGPRR